MQVSYNWLRDNCAYEGSFKDFCDTLSLTGTKVEAGFEAFKDITGVKTGKIVEIKPHPDADRLVVCQLNFGGPENLQILTAAPNVAEGQIVPVALDSATLANDLKIKKTKMRGLASNGMLCSIEELGLEHADLPDAPDNGIYIMAEDTPLGVDPLEYLGFRDHWIEFEITPNRPDCLAVDGIAREAAVSFDVPLTLSNKQADPQDFNDKATTDDVTLEVTDATACPRYQGWIIDDVVVEPSPLWMRQRLRSAGLRPINNLVDITNYVMLQTGNPLHAFDFGIIEDGKIIVKNAAEGEKFKTLDGVERELKATDLVISDPKKTLALAGVMGGEDSEITDQTKSVFLEIANFNQDMIRKTSTRLALYSDSSQRFVRGISRDTVDRALQLALYLITELKAGVPRKSGVNFASEAPEPTEIEFHAHNISKRLGVEIEENWMLDTFEKLGFEIKAGLGHRMLVVPSWRGDVTSEADLSEEVARFYGYNNIPARLFSGETTKAAKRTPEQQREQTLRRILLGAGAFEAMSSPFGSAQDFRDLGIEDALQEAIKIRNPLGKEREYLAMTLLPRHLEHIALNQIEREEDLYFFEMGRTFRTAKEQNSLPDERKALTVSLYRKGASGADLFFEVKGLLEEIFEHLNFDNVRFEPVERPYLQPGQSATVYVGEEALGVIGRVHPDVLKLKNAKGPIVVAELDLTRLLELAGHPFAFHKPSKFPATERDLAILCPKDLPHVEVVDLIQRAGGKHLTKVELFDHYEGDNIAPDKKSLAYRLTFRSDTETLTDKFVDKHFRKVIDKLAEAGLEIRDH